MLVTEQNQVNIIQRKTSIQQQSMLAEKILRRLKISDVTSVEPMKSVAIDYIKEQISINMYFQQLLRWSKAGGWQSFANEQDFEINLSPEYVKALGYTSSKALATTVEDEMA